MRLRIQRLRLEIDTDKGLFGVDLNLQQGLNVFRADNSAGKSTLVMALMYGLGLEGALNPKNTPPFAHAVTSWLEHQGARVPVLSSRVWLEVYGDSDEVVSVRRDIVGSSPHLVRTWSGVGLDRLKAGTRSDYFVRQPGSATREKGFHTFLADLMGANLPKVPTYDGREVPLYLECLLPQVIVEQKEGWSPIWGRYPTWFRIREVHTRVMEYLLRLDRVEDAAKIARLRSQLAVLESDWRSLARRMYLIAEEGGLTLAGISRELPQERGLAPPTLSFAAISGKDEIEHRPVLEFLSAAEARAVELRQEMIPTAEAMSEEHQDQLREVRRQVKELEGRLSRALLERESIESERTVIDRRIAGVASDLRRYADLEKLRQLGSDADLHMSRDTCPTCKQRVTGSLVGQSAKEPVLNERESIDYLKQKEQVYRVVRNQLVRRRDQVDSVVAALDRELTEARQVSEALRRTLDDDSRLPSRALLEELLRLERKVKVTMEVIDTTAEWQTKLELMAERGVEIRALLKSVGKGTSQRDRGIQNMLSVEFPRYCAEFGVAQLESSGLAVNEDTFFPFSESHAGKLQYELSASDAVRAAWSYRLAVLSSSTRFEGNHPGLLVLDEPRQQSAKLGSFSRLLGEMVEVAGEGRNQILVATSEENLAGLMAFDGRDQAHWIIAGNGKVLVPIDPLPH